MNRLKDSLPLHLLRPALAALSLTVLVATVTATVLSPSGAEATVLPPRSERPVCGRQALEARSTATSAADETRRATGADNKKKPRKAGKKKQKKQLTGVLNINNATTAQLRLLPGVGPAKAERVVNYRKRHGNFKRVKDLRRVKGFGYKSLKKLEKWLTVKGETTLAKK